MHRFDDWMLYHPVWVIGGIVTGLAFLSVLMGFGILYVADGINSAVEGHTVVLSTGAEFECTAAGD